MKLFILSGAGLSAPSGLATFRGSGGLWNGHSLEEVCSPVGFVMDPKKVHDFYNNYREEVGKYKPNAAHEALARLESEYPGGVFHVTQNLDDLCEHAGGNVLHMHGEIMKMRCQACRAIVAYTCSGKSSTDTECPHCGNTGTTGGLRPHVVWFGELPLYTKEIMDALTTCDMYIAIGTSGSVYPASSYVHMAQEFGTPSVCINKEMPLNGHFFTHKIIGDVTEEVPKFVEQLINKVKEENNAG